MTLSRRESQPRVFCRGVHPNPVSNNPKPYDQQVLPSKTRQKQCAGETTNVGEVLRTILSFCMAAALAGMVGAVSVQAQEATSAQQSPAGTVRSTWNDVSRLASDSQQPTVTTDGKSSLPDAPAPAANSTTDATTKPTDAANPEGEYGKQPKRILWVIPNYRAVSANEKLPPLSFKGAMWLATQDTFDYSSFIFVGALAGVSMAGKSQPTFGQGAEGYGKYYWHTFVDGAIENYMTEAIVPAATREDPRYYTMGKGGFVKRTGYAVSRLLVTRTNSGKSTFNLSEIVGAGAAAGIGNTYYPAEYNPWVKTYQRWGTQVGLDGVFNVLKEFWPDIDQAVFHGKY